MSERWHPRRAGERFWGSCAMVPIRTRPGGEPTGFVKVMRDETTALEARQAVEQSRVFLEDALRNTEAVHAGAERPPARQAKDHFLGGAQPRTAHAADARQSRCCNNQRIGTMPLS